MGAYLDKDKKSHWYYEEPDFERYTENLSNSCKHLTRVIYDDNTTIKVGGSELPDSVLMGINTKEFGETAELKSGFMINSMVQIPEQYCSWFISPEPPTLDRCYCHP